MESIKFLSGFVRGFKYHEQKQILDVTGYDGSIYQYFEVPENVISELSTSNNPGDYYKKHIRNKFRRLFKAYDYTAMF